MYIRGKLGTYAMLTDRILRWLSFFSTKDYKKGERIAVIAPNHPELFAILFACEMKGLIFVPLNWRLSLFELETLIKDCTPSILLFHKEYSELVEKMAYPNSIALHSIFTMDVLTTKDGQPIPKQRNGNEPWMIIYTGGTTGAAKGVVISYDAVNWNAFNTIVSWGLTEDDTTISYMPLFHTGGINALSLPILMAGGTVIIGSTFDAREALEATDQYGATISLFVPTMYQSMIKTTYFQQSSFPTMKVFLSGGAPCPKTIYYSFHNKGLQFKEGYGLTEAGPNNFYIRPEDSCRKVGSVGKCMMFNSVKVLNDKGLLCKIDEVGELFINGPHVFSYYWQNQEATVNTLQDGWLRTGDLARVDSEGDYYIVGRKKDLIISGGENVYPQEVEQCLVHFDGIVEAAVVGVQDDTWGEAVTAFITLVDGYTFNRTDIIDHCKKFLGTYKIPKNIYILNELPKTHVGKIDKIELLKKA